MVEKLKKLRIGKENKPLLSTNQKTAFIYKVELTKLIRTGMHIIKCIK
jgi:hypothetical protein